MKVTLVGLSRHSNSKRVSMTEFEYVIAHFVTDTTRFTCACLIGVICMESDKYFALTLMTIVGRR